MQAFFEKSCVDYGGQVLLSLTSAMWGAFDGSTKKKSVMYINIMRFCMVSKQPQVPVQSFWKLHETLGRPLEPLASVTFFQKREGFVFHGSDIGLYGEYLDG
jgi:hypothetical protein